MGVTIGEDSLQSSEHLGLWGPELLLIAVLALSGNFFFTFGLIHWSSVGEATEMVSLHFWDNSFLFVALLLNFPICVLLSILVACLSNTLVWGCGACILGSS